MYNEEVHLIQMKLDLGTDCRDSLIRQLQEFAFTFLPAIKIPGENLQLEKTQAWVFAQKGSGHNLPMSFQKSKTERVR